MPYPLLKQPEMNFLCSLCSMPDGWTVKLIGYVEVCCNAA
jgi:hypothetical protein